MRASIYNGRHAVVGATWVILIGFYLFLYSFNSAFAAGETEKITVDAEGSGETKMAAMKDAWTDAVRKAVGMYMTSKSEVSSEPLNEKYTEEIAAYSRGQVNSFETLSETQENGLWHVKIRANVDRDIMRETVAAATTQKVALDGSNLAAQLQSGNDQKKDAVELIKTSGLLDFGKSLDYSVKIQTGEADDKKLVFARHLLKFNLDKFKKQAEALETLVAKVASGKREASLKADRAKKALKLIGQKEYDIKLSKYILDELFGKRGIKQLAYGAADNVLMLIDRDGRWRQEEGRVMIKGQWKPAIAGTAYTADWDDVLSFEIENDAKYSNEICFLRNAAKATCYKVGREVRNLIASSRPGELRFYIESGSGYDNTLEVSPSLIWLYPLLAGQPDSPLLYAPSTGFIFHDGYSGSSEVSIDAISNQVPVLVCYQIIDVPVDDLAAMKELTGKYTLELSTR